MMRPIAVLSLTALLLVAGCGGEGNQTPADRGGDLDDTPAEMDAPMSAVTEVAMRDIKFAPEHIRVKPGTTIQWENFDNVPHNAVATEGADFESELFGKGGTYTYTPDEAGAKIKYVCTIHPGMEGTITVTG